MTIDGTTVLLREMLPEDLPALFALQRDREARWMAAFTPADTDDEAAYRHRWERLIADPRVLNRSVLVDGDIVGSAGAFELKGELEVTYWIDRAFWGRGIATRALALLLPEVPGRPVYGRVAHDNAASARVLERNGFVRSGDDRFFANARGEEIAEVIYRLG